jgi:hypothetical protein
VLNLLRDSRDITRGVDCGRGASRQEHHRGCRYSQSPCRPYPASMACRDRTVPSSARRAAAQAIGYSSDHGWIVDAQRSLSVAMHAALTASMAICHEGLFGARSPVRSDARRRGGHQRPPDRCVHPTAYRLAHGACGHPHPHGRSPRHPARVTRRRRWASTAPCVAPKERSPAGRGTPTLTALTGTAPRVTHVSVLAFPTVASAKKYLAHMGERIKGPIPSTGKGIRLVGVDRQSHISDGMSIWMGAEASVNETVGTQVVCTACATPTGTTATSELTRCAQSVPRAQVNRLR